MSDLYPSHGASSIRRPEPISPRAAPRDSTLISSTSRNVATSPQRSLRRISNSSRRPSPLLHEIQTPTRRLSSHQVLLLIPFGESIPDTLEGGPSGSGSGRTARRSLGSIHNGRGGGSMAMSAVSDVKVSGATGMIPSSTSMGREPSMGIPQPRSTRRSESGVNPPSRHRLSFATSPNAPSPLSRGLTTITSESDSGPSSLAPSRDISIEDEDNDEGVWLEEPEMVLAVSVSTGTVAMTRSNSLPVLTQSELEAMKDKDMELGISRGGDWAWVDHGREGGDGVMEEDEEDLETPGLSETTTSTFTSTTSPSSTPTAGGPIFNDPFASVFDPPARDGTFRRVEETARFGNYRPVATMAVEGYHYSPSNQVDRRMSDIPLPFTPSALSSRNSTSHISPRHRVNDVRRPSAPVSTSRSMNVAGTKPLEDTPRISGLESPRGTYMPSPTRPRIARYNSSPARSQGLGLSIIVGPETVDQGGGLGRRKANAMGSGTAESLSTVERREQRHARLRERDQEEDEIQPGESQGEFSRRGSWAPAGIVDSLELVGGSLGSFSSLDERRNTGTSTSSNGSSSPRHSIITLPRNSISASISSSISAGTTTSGGRRNILLVNVDPLTLSEFGIIPQTKGIIRRGRFDSLDSALPNRSLQVSLSDQVRSVSISGLEGGAFGKSLPRRGSGGLLGLWRKKVDGMSGG